MSAPIVVGVDGSASALTAARWAAAGRGGCGRRSRGRPGVELDLEVVIDRPAAALIAASRGARSGVLGSTSQALVHHAPCPPAVVRPVTEE